jgi:hypothetical protein
LFTEPNDELSLTVVVLNNCPGGIYASAAGSKFNQITALETLRRLGECGPRAVISPPEQENLDLTAAPESNPPKSRWNHLAVICHE